MHRSRAMKVAAATSISRMRRKRPYKGVNCARRRRRQQFFPFMEAAGAGPSSSEGEHVRVYDIQAAIVPRTTCVSDLQPGSTTTRTEGDVVRMCDQVQVTTMRFSRPGDIIGAEGGEADPQDATKWGRLGSTGLRAMPSE